MVPTVAVEVIEGRPGSGKTFFMVGRILDAIVEQKRPVYTNAPLRLRVVRQWLRNRGGEAFARLIHPLTRDGFNRFLSRAAARNRELEAWRSDRRVRGLDCRESTFRAHWLRKAGPDIVDGPELNWIPPFAIICIDEVHHWFAQRDQGKAETPDLLAYLTMHRHHGHDVWVASQDRMQVSLSFRRQAACYWHVRNRGEDRVAWGVRLKHFGVSAFGYAKYSPESEDAKPGSELAGPLSDHTVFPWLPSQSWRFRLYDSFTHVGGVRRLQAMLEAARVEAGVDMLAGLKSTGKEKSMHRVYLVLVACLAFVLGSVVGGGVGAARVGQLQAVEPVLPEFIPRGFGSSGPLVPGGVLKLGATHDGYTLEAFDRRSRSLVVSRDGLVYAFRGGSWRHVGEVGQVVERIRAARTSAPPDGSPVYGEVAPVAGVGPASRLD